jgi:predicted RNA-binding Zn-ribbon protein involved in translation (DUF1610 family)
MVSRNTLECSACGTQVTTRTQLGHRDQQRHSFACPKCGVMIEFSIDLDQKRGKWSYHEPTNAKWIESRDLAPHVLTFSDEIPVPVDMGGGFSPFLATWFKIENQDAYRRDEGLRQLFVNTFFPYAERCRIHYERGNWALFDKESPSPGEVPTPRSRLIALYNLYTAGFSKFSLNRRGRHDRIHQRLALAEVIASAKFAEFLKLCLVSGRIERLWKEIAAIRTSLVSLYPKIQPLMQVLYWPEASRNFESVVLSDKAFNELRQLYVDCFETLCRLIVIALGVEAMIHHGTLEIPTNRSSLTLDEFEGLPNAGKVEHLKKYPIEDLFAPALDAPFRNAIGRHATHYEKASDRIIIYDSRYDSRGSSKPASSIGYTEFSNKVLQLFSAFELATMYHHHVHIELNGQFK